MKFFLTIFIVLLLVVTVGLMLLFYYLRKGYRFFRGMVTGDVDEETFKRMSNKYYKSKNKGDEFDTDYFKGKGWQHSADSGQQQASQRTTRTAEGVTIVDRRPEDETRKKIFAPDEGEYVEFTE